MTRDEFINDVTTWDELVEFCYDKDLYTCEDIYSEYAMNECIDEELVGRVRDHHWDDVRDWLNNLPDYRSDYWLRDDCGDWVGLEDGDDTFEDYKRYALEAADRDDLWDDESDDEEEVEYEQTAEEDEEQIDVGELFELVTIYNSSVQILSDEFEHSMNELFS